MPLSTALRTFSWTVATGALLLSGGAAMLGVSGMRDDRRPSDIAVVLGNQVYRDGRPSPRLAARLDEAVRIWRANLVKAVVVSGGIDRNGTDEAAAMRRYLVGKNIPASAILMDPHGVNTWETARNTTAIMKAHAWHSAMVISQYFHIPRTKLAFRQFGISDPRSSSPTYVEWRDVYSISREVIGYPAYWLR